MDYRASDFPLRQALKTPIVFHIFERWSKLSIAAQSLGAVKIGERRDSKKKKDRTDALIWGPRSNYSSILEGTDLRSGLKNQKNGSRPSAESFCTV